MSEPVVEWYVRGRFVELPGARATRIRANAWEVLVPRSPEVRRAMRADPTPEAFDGGVMGLGEHESQQVMGAGERDGCVVVTVLL